MWTQSTATIMFGHVETYDHIAEHLINIKNQQIKSGGFTEFVPLPFVAHEAPMSLRGQSRSGPTFREAISHALHFKNIFSRPYT